MPSLFVTGATGYVGSTLVGQVADNPDISLTALVRSIHGPPPASNIAFVEGDLLGDDAWHTRLDGIDTVVHLAAATGKIPPATIKRVNVDGTARLLEQCRLAGVARFLFVSSVAAKFSDAPHYHYAASKSDAEQHVTDSGLDTLIVRPTMVLGGDSPIGARLRALATAPILPVFGNGRARIQPIHVADLASTLLDLAVNADFDGRTIDAAGPDTISIEDLLRRVRQAVRGTDGPVLHVPLGPLRAVIAGIERVSVHIVPFTAGQLATFTNDGTAGDGQNACHPEHGLDEMIADMARDG